VQRYPCVVLTRGVRRRNERLARLRAVVRPELAIVAIDLASAKQAVVVCDHDSVVLARRMFSGSAWAIDAILDWAEPVARAAGFAGVVVACEPTGHRWKPLLERTRARGVELVCVQPLLVHRGREGEDFTRERSDFHDAAIIARLASELRCYVPYALEGEWARLRHLGARRNGQLVVATGARQALRDLLECAWPGALAAAAKPLDSLTWRAAMAVSSDPQVIAALGYDAFARRVGAQLRALGGRRRNHRIMRAVFAAAQAPDGLAGERAAACERAAFVLADYERALCELADVQARMLATLERLGLRALCESVDGLSAIGAVAILAETGDPARYGGPRSWPKHAGICPRANESGSYRGQTKTSGRGRPALRTAVWRAIWGLLPHDPVYQARYQHLTTRERNQLTDGQARAALGAALLRQLFVVITRRVPWDAAIAAGDRREEVTLPQAA
jgi:transposase